MKKLKKTFFYTIRCGVHTFQLCINDILLSKNIYGTSKYNEQEIKDIEKIRKTIDISVEMTKECSKTYIRDELHNIGHALPPLPNSTRWDGKYTMLVSLSNLYLKLEKKIYLNIVPTFSKNIFIKINSLISILKILFHFTQLSQKDFMPISEFKIYWNFTKVCLTNLKRKDALLFGRAMATREEKFLCERVSSLTTFFDIRFRPFTSSADLLILKIEIMSIMEKIPFEHLGELNCERSEVSKNSELSTDNITILPNGNLDLTLDDYLGDLNNKNKLTKSQITNNSSLDIEIDAYLPMECIGKSENLITFWLSMKKELPILYSVAVSILSILATEVSVERTFSMLKFILSDVRMRIKAEILDKLITLKFNSTLLECLNK